MSASRLWGGDKKEWLIGAGIGVLVVGVVIVLHFALRGDQGDCPEQSRQNLASAAPPLWTLSKPEKDTQVGVALEHYVQEPRYGTVFVTVRPTSRNKKHAPLPPKAPIGAFLLGGNLSDGTRALSFPLVATARRSPDGRAIHVSVCAERPSDRSDDRPGEYGGTLRVVGRRVQAVDVPVTLTIKGSWKEAVAIIFVVSLLGAAVAASNSKPPEVTQDQVQQKRTRHLLLSLLPFLTGLIAGLVAGLIVYADDPTWAAERGADIAKLVGVTFAAATGGLTAAAPAARAARQRIAQ